MGTVLFTLKLMPESLDVSLEDLKSKVQAAVEAGEGKNVQFDEEPVAFGLKALILMYNLNEDKEAEPIENAINEIEGVSSLKVTDMRRAIE